METPAPMEREVKWFLRQLVQVVVIALGVVGGLYLFNKFGAHLPW